mmetsp:Transcript_3044/g.7306  ORF Transcript_3044/g.7306 Transcript_3044/m.7306 type:complete len:251 (+) Transcript_3044:4195-4947(+)
MIVVYRSTGDAGCKVIVKQIGCARKVGFFVVQVGPKLVGGFSMNVQLLRGVRHQAPQRCHPEGDDLGFSRQEVAFRGKYGETIRSLNRYSPDDWAVVVGIANVGQVPTVQSRFQFIAIPKLVVIAIAITITDFVVRPPTTRMVVAVCIGVASLPFPDVVFPIFHFYWFVVGAIFVVVVVNMEEEQIFQKVKSIDLVLAMIQRAMQRRCFGKGTRCDVRGVRTARQHVRAFFESQIGSCFDSLCCGRYGNG